MVGRRDRERFHGRRGSAALVGEGRCCPSPPSPSPSPQQPSTYNICIPIPIPIPHPFPNHPQDISKSYNGVRRQFKDASLTLGQSCRVGLIGVNGVGKSTLLRCLAGLESVDSGSIGVEVSWGWSGNTRATVATTTTTIAAANATATIATATTAATIRAGLPSYTSSRSPLAGLATTIRRGLCATCSQRRSPTRRPWRSRHCMSIGTPARPRRKLARATTKLSRARRAK